MPLEVSHFGSYEILAPIGAGGMGEVYKARDTRLDRVVALKILPSGFAQDKERIRRFITEAKAAASISHPNVAQIFEVGQTEEIRFIAMEYVEGRTLDKLIQTKPLEPSKVVQIGIQIANALQEASQKGVTHRDIKPSNIMLTINDVVKVLDFGLARVIKDLGSTPGTQLSTMTRTKPGTVFGTIQYLSPEQALGFETDHRSDIFALGIVLYELSTAQLPFRGKTAGETLDQIIHGQPRLPSQLNRHVPADLERVILKCLEKKSERRFQSASELSKDLKSLKATRLHLPIFIRRLTYIKSRIAVILLPVLLFAAAGWYFASVSSGMTIDSLAILPFVNENKDPEADYLSDGITESLIQNLSQLPKLRVLSRDSAFSFKGKKITAQKAGSDLHVAAVVSGNVSQRGDQLTVQAELIKTVDGSRLWSAKYQGRPIDAASIQEQISNEISRKLAKQQTVKHRSSNNEAYQFYLKGRYFLNKGDEENFRKAIEYFNQAIRKDPKYAAAYAGLADSYVLATYETFIHPREGLPTAKAAALKVLELDPNLPEAHVTMGTIRLGSWEFAEEEREYKKAIRLNPNYADAHHWYAEHLVMMGRTVEGMMEMRRAQELDPSSSHINAQLANYLLAFRRYDEAIKICKKIEQQDPGINKLLAEIYAQKGMYKESIATRLKTIPESHPEAAIALSRIFATSGYEAAMKDHWQRTLTYYEKATKQWDVEFYELLAFLNAILNKNDQAFYWLEQGYKEHSPILPQTLSGFRLDPEFKDVRSDPRFAKLLQRVGLPVRSDWVEFQH